MTSEAMREYLSGPAGIEERIRDREDKIAALRSVAAKVTPSLSFAPGSSGRGGDHRLENIIAKIDGLERENREDEDRLLALTLEIDELLDSLPNMNYRRVLRMSFIELKSGAQICKEMNFSRKYVERLRREAVTELTHTL